ncbi:hypothetical protein ACVIGA_008323 [Bradyrhizobium sp. USDA 3240]
MADMGQTDDPANRGASRVLRTEVISLRALRG